jgi:hypothetical protein
MPLFANRRALVALVVVALVVVVAAVIVVVRPSTPSPSARWQQIENRWTPVREKARADLVQQGADFNAQLADYKAFYDATKGWLDDVAGYKDWARAGVGGQRASAYVQTFLSDGDNYLALLKAAYQAKTPDDILVMQDTLPAADQTWETDRALVRVALGLAPAP